ncbi:hypothetical protein H6G33_09960 [Calothrix sp. FACHB-1219]|uniref:hypothetical protein n=1 Tax=unclassified Calothrix TaxID=2619626 RepID=UPI001684AAD0|nr:MULTISPECIES: hypothetical protein [unclassified Calothrix]MBD2201671.1 hypothetical protein [Calothrix sp. FACHB-168]MBD2217357.1 hypothetical protein [Calothrix sp. FACHB-1219]
MGDWYLVFGYDFYYPRGGLNDLKFEGSKYDIEQRVLKRSEYSDRYSIDGNEWDVVKVYKKGDLEEVPLSEFNLKEDGNRW